jgi:predicted PurR-regulated permease PerM
MAIIMTQPKEQGIRGWIQLLLGLSLTVLFVYMMAPFIEPFLLGAVCAILCYPTYGYLKRYTPRPVAAAITTVGLTLLVLVPVVFMLYGSTYRLWNILKKLRILKEGQTFESLIDHPLLKKTIGGLSRWVEIDREWVHSQALDVLQTIVERLTTSIGGFLGSIPSLLIGILIVVLTTYFFLADGARFLRFLQSLSPMKLDRSVELYGAFERSCRGVVLGLFISGVVQGILMAILFVFTDMPDPIFIFMITIVAGMIPIVGSAPIWMGALVYHIFQDHWGFASIMLVGGILVSTSDNIVRPLVMKGHAEMHPLLALVSVFGAVHLFGPTGIFLGPVIAAVFVSFLKILSLELRRESIATTTNAN